MPGHWNTVSVMMAKAMIEPSCRPVMVMTGTRVFFSAWPKLTARLLQAACPGKLDVVGAQHLQHLGPHQAHDQGELEHAQRDRGHDHVPSSPQGQQDRWSSQPDIHHLAAPEGRQPAEPHAEHQDQQDADEEGGQRDADQRHGEEDLGSARNRACSPCRPPSEFRSAARIRAETRHQLEVAGRRSRDQLDRPVYRCGRKARTRPWRVERRRSGANWTTTGSLRPSARAAPRAPRSVRLLAHHLLTGSPT